MKLYPAYKPSGVQWLGEVPEHWEIRRLKFVLQEVEERSETGNETLLSLTRSRGLIPQSDASERGPSADTQVGYRVCKPGEVVMNRMQAWSGMFAEPPVKGLVSPDYMVFEPIIFVNTTYLTNVFKTKLYASHFTIRSRGIGTGFFRLYTPDFNAVSIPLPSIDEQTVIVSYLDRKNAEIDGFVASKRKLIALLNEGRAAFIQKVVLRGLNPDAPMKQTSVDWLGEVPEHWEVRRNISLFGQRIERGIAELPILVVSLHTGVTVGDEDSADAPQRLIEDRTSYKRTNTGDIAYNMMRMWQGAVGVTPVDGLVSPAYVVAYPLENVDSRFYCYLFRTDVYKNEVNRQSRGIVSDRNRLYWQDFKQMLSPFPPLAEQQAIVAEIEEQSQRIDAAISQIEREIELINEYRTALISEVVTGKIDVRDRG